MSRYVVYEDDNVLVEVEVINTKDLFLHCKVTKWNKSIYFLLLDVFDKLLLELKSKGIYKIYSLSDNPKLSKFCEMMLMTYVTEDEKHSLYVREAE